VASDSKNDFHKTLNICKRHQNVELEFTTVQTRQEDDIGNGLSPGKTDMAAVLRDIMEIQPGNPSDTNM